MSNLVTSPRQPALRGVLGAVVLASTFVSISHAQVLDLSAGPPVVMLESRLTLSVVNSHPQALADNQGRQVAITYDTNGRPVAFKVGPKLNIADMRMLYDPSGRIGAVRFANGYAVRFQYGANGTQTVSDVLGKRTQ